MDDNGLIAAAAGMVEQAYAPYSGARVGAAVLTEGGEVFAACNVENASYGLTICAERAAIFAAVAAGHRRVVKVAIAADGIKYPLPCGACLQVMKEFGVEQVLVAKPGGHDTYGFPDLLPRPFEL